MTFQRYRGFFHPPLEARGGVWCEHLPSPKFLAGLKISTLPQREGGIIALALALQLSAASAPPAGAQTASIPNLSGQWGRTYLNLEQPPSGPGPLQNTVLRPDGTILDQYARIADYNSPLLTKEGAAILKAHGEFSAAGNAIPDPHNQCRPEPPPYVHAIEFGVQILQKKDEVVLIYPYGPQIRRVRLNGQHPNPVVPSWRGDSVGHYEGDTLVVDTVGMRTGPLAVLDRYGTPFGSALHVVERYRLIDAKTATEAEAKHLRLYGDRVVPNRFDPWGSEIDLSPDKMSLRVEVTVDDAGIFTRPWTGLLTYRPKTGMWAEVACAENLQEPPGLEKNNPVDDTPDF
jgi:hypothetical protein